MRCSDALIRDFYAIRTLRNRLKSERDSLLCERHERAELPEGFDWDTPLPEPKPPCWKAARQWERDRDGEPTRRFYLDPPPSEWCAACRRRQEVSDAYRESVRRHGGALRGLLRRGRVLESATQVGAVDPHV
jgi:hypothetical protein